MSADNKKKIVSSAKTATLSVGSAFGTMVAARFSSIVNDASACYYLLCENYRCSVAKSTEHYLSIEGSADCISIGWGR